jgi:Tol biopolymer transport system component/DNA-binding winged helix-turn-helix (wHTH) protein
MATAEGAGRQPKIRFDSFELDLERQTLSRDGVLVKLQRQPCQVLTLLVERAPEIVSREEIQRHVWGNAVHIDADQSINFCIRQIRSALADNSSAPRFVETLPRQGYRFVAVREGLPVETGIQADQPAQNFPPRKSLQERFLIPGLISLALFSLLAASWIWYAKRDTALRVAALLPLTTYPGEEIEPALSPDGGQVAFTWNGENKDVAHIYVTTLGGQQAIRLTQSPQSESYPAWSPDGRHIAFTRWHTDSQADIVVVPAQGGSERIVHRVQLGRLTENSGRVLAWSPDSKWLCLVSEPEPSGHHFLFFLSLESGALRRLPGGTGKDLGDSAPAFSADGRWLAFVRLSGPQVSRLMLQRLSSSLEPQGDPLEVKEAGTNPRTPVWAPDGEKIFFLDAGNLMQAGIDTPARRIYVANSLEGLSMAAHKLRLVAGQGDFSEDLRTIPLRSAGLIAAADPSPIVRSTADDSMPSYSPDGRWLAFSSWRTGSSEIWLADADGKNPRQLTHLSAYIAAFAHWSPDSRFVTFHARTPKVAQIYVTRIEDGLTRQVSDGLTDLVIPSWSEDGKSIYAGQVDGGSLHTYSLPVAGGAPRLLWDGIGSMPIEAPGRKLLLYAKSDITGVYARSLDGDPRKNPELKLIDDYIPHKGGICPVKDGFYYSASTASGISRAIRFYSFASHKSVDVAPLPAGIGLGISVSPDRSRLAYTAPTSEEVDLVEIALK